MTTRKNKPQDPRVYDGQMMEPVLTPPPREFTGKAVGFGVGRQVNAAQVRALYVKGQPPAASPDLVVTISGATGKGKTVLARIIAAAMSVPHPGAHYKFAAPNAVCEGRNFKAGTDIERLGDYRTVMIVESCD